MDDNVAVRRLIAAIVGPTGFDLIECADGADALEAYETHRPDVVLMDISMPQLDGIAATAALLAAHSLARVVIVSDYDGADLQQAAARAGACGFVSKDRMIELDPFLRRLLGLNSGS